MKTLRARVIAVVAAALVILGSGVALNVMPAAAAGAAVCPNQVYLGYIRSGLSNYLDDYGGGSGTYVHTYQFTGSASQTWCVERATQVRGGFFLHPTNNTGLCLDAHQNTAGYPMWVYSCNGSDPQRWCWNGHGYITRWNAGKLGLKDTGRYNIVQLGQGDATQWYTNGAVFSDNC